MKLSKSKKGVIGQLFPLILSLVVIAITLAITFLILAEVKSNDKVTADANATAAVTKTQQAMDDIPGYEDMDLHASSEGYLSLSLQLLALC